MKKVAVAQMNESSISKHFGRSPYFGIYSISNDQIEGSEMRLNTFTHHARQGHHHDHAHGNEQHHTHNHSHESVVEGLSDCQVLIAGGMGMGAINSLSDAGIEIIITEENDPMEAVQKYIHGTLKNQNTGCDK
jgi:predicted Fe-Mo cluster-binding NifX family protein